jgi:sugar phosphate isomerase/epimerase
MLKTRTGGFAIGVRRLTFHEWHKDLAAFIKRLKELEIGVIDLGTDGDTTAKQVVDAGMRIGSIDLPRWKEYISKDAGKRREAIEGAKAYIEACCAAAGPVNFFVVMLPEDPGLPRSENFGYMVESYRELTPTLEKHQSTIAIEGWPGPGALCCTPETLRAFFKECPSKAMGFNFDPSHLIRMGIDPLRFLREFGDRVVHIHGKDCELLSEELYEYGNEQAPAFGGGRAFGGSTWRYCMPGYGAMRWSEGFRILEGFGYQGAISIEHEDGAFLGESSEWGITLGSRYLSGC